MSLIPILPPSSSRAFAPVGLDHDGPAVRRTLDGRIDFDWYLGRASRLRAQYYAGLFRAIGRGIGAAYAAWVRALRERRARKQALADLLGLDDRALRDMGLNRGGVVYAVDHGREDVPSPANVNTAARSPRAA